MKKPKSKCSCHIPTEVPENKAIPTEVHEHKAIPTEVHENKAIPVQEAVKETKEDVPKKVRKPNPWIIKCQEVQARPENSGSSYREIMKNSKLEYTK